MSTVRLGGLRLGGRRSRVTRRVVQHWDRFPRVVVHSLPFEIFKTEVDKAMAELLWCCQHSFGRDSGLDDHQKCLPTITLFSFPNSKETSLFLCSSTLKILILTPVSCSQPYCASALVNCRQVAAAGPAEVSVQCGCMLLLFPAHVSLKNFS